MVNLNSTLKPIMLFLLTTLFACQSETKIEAAQIKATPKVIQEKDLKNLLTTENSSEWCFTMQVPDGNWGLKLSSIYEDKSGGFIVLASLNRSKGAGIQMISNATICAPFKPEGKPVYIYITGKTWGWNNKEKAKFVKKWPNMDSAARLVYRPVKDIKPIKPKPIDIRDL